MITIHSKKYNSSSGWPDDYQDWLINPDQISYCDPLKFKVVMCGGGEFQILGKEWPEFVKQATKKGTV